MTIETIKKNFSDADEEKKYLRTHTFIPKDEYYNLEMHSNFPNDKSLIKRLFSSKNERDEVKREKVLFALSDEIQLLKKADPNDLEKAREYVEKQCHLTSLRRSRKTEDGFLRYRNDMQADLHIFLNNLDVNGKLGIINIIEEHYYNKINRVTPAKTEPSFFDRFKIQES